MESNKRNIVTAPGDSDPQVPAVVGGSGVKTGSNVVGPLRSLSYDREGTGVASQAPVTLPSTSAEEDDRLYDLGPFSYIDEVEIAASQVCKLAKKLKTFCDNNRNVHQPIKAMAVEFQKAVEAFSPSLARLRRSTAAVDREVSDLSTSIRLREFNESMTAKTSSPKRMMTTSASCQTEAANEVFKTAPTTVAVRKTQDERGKKVNKKEKKKRKKSETRNVKGKIRVTHSQGITISKGIGVGTYSDMVKKLKDEINLDEIGVQIQAIKKTKDDGLFLLVGKGAKAREEAAKLKRAAEQALGSDAVVRNSSRPCVIEVRGIGEDDKEDDVILGVCRYGVNPNEVHVRKMGTSFGGYQRALVSVPITIAEKIIARGRVLVGLVSCRVRLKGDPAVRCYKCHGYYHKAQSCGGPDRSKLCMTCGGDGHIAKQCQSAPNCVLCSELKRPADHYPGSGRCEAYRKARLKTKHS